MAVYERRTLIEAPLEEVWAFHATVKGLRAVTPDWLNLRIESVVGPEADTDLEELVVGAEVRASIRPFGVGPRQSWTSRIVSRDAGDGKAHFRDEMTDGPFPRWSHTHRFRARGEATEMVDRVAYVLPWPLGPVSALGWPGFELIFRGRHRRIRRRLGR